MTDAPRSGGAYYLEGVDMGAKDAVEKLTPGQIEVLERIRRDPLSGGPHTAFQLRSFESLRKRGLVKHIFGGRKTIRIGAAAGNSWYEITADGMRALKYTEVLGGKERAVTLDSQDMNTIAAALKYYRDAGMGEPSNRTDAIHDIACGEDVGLEDISSDDEGIRSLMDRVNQLRSMSRKSVGQFVRMHFCETDGEPRPANPVEAPKKKSPKP